MNHWKELIRTENDELQILYAADGALLQRKYVVNGMTKNKIDYEGDKEWHNDTLEYIHHAHGRVIKHNSLFDYEYKLSDNLGNTRVTFTDSNNDNAVTIAERRSAVDYYTFGLEHYSQRSESEYGVSKNLYKYNGNETIPYMGSGLMDFNARMYSPEIGRFFHIDALSFETPQISGFSFSNNNPILFSDPTGLYGQNSNGIASDHVDTKSNFIAHYDDGDENTYVHNVFTSKSDLDNNLFYGTSRGGDNILGMGPKAVELQKYSAKIYLAGLFTNHEIEQHEYMMAYFAIEDDYYGMGRQILKKYKWSFASYLPWFRALRLLKGSKIVIGMTQEGAKFAALSPQADHAMRHLIDKGIISGSKNSSVARNQWNILLNDILTNPSKSFDYFLQGARTKGFYKVVNGQDVVIFVTKHNHGAVLQGQVIGGWVPTKVLNPDIMSLIGK